MKEKRNGNKGGARLFPVLRGRRGESYLEVVVLILAFSFILLTALEGMSLMARAQDARTVAERLCFAAAEAGCVDVPSAALELQDTLGISFTYSFEGSETFDASGHVQLGDRIVCRVSVTGRLGNLEFPVQASALSSSRVYYKEARA